MWPYTPVYSLFHGNSEVQTPELLPFPPGHPQLFQIFLMGHSFWFPHHPLGLLWSYSNWFLFQVWFTPRQSGTTPSYFQILCFTKAQGSNVTLRLMPCPCSQPCNVWLCINSRFLHGSNINILDHFTSSSLGKIMNICGQFSGIGYLGYLYNFSYYKQLHSKMTFPQKNFF